MQTQSIHPQQCSFPYKGKIGQADVEEKRKPSERNAGQAAVSTQWPAELRTISRDHSKEQFGEFQTVKELLSCTHSERSSRKRGLFQTFSSRGWKLEQAAAGKRDSTCCQMAPGHRVLMVNTSESPIQQAKRKHQVPCPLFQRALMQLLTHITLKHDYMLYIKLYISFQLCQLQ